MNEIELTQELVKIDSQNPTTGEKEVSKYIYDFLLDLKIQSEMLEFEKNRYEVVAELGKGSGLMFNGHIDTVPVGDANKWKYDPFSGKIIGGKLYGRGSSDMKSGAACILAAVEKMKRTDLKRRLLLTFVGDEEVSQKGSNFIIKKRHDLLKDVEYGIFGESSSMKVTFAQKGIVHVKIKFRGKSVHGSTPERGVNAIEKAVKFLSNLEKLNPEMKRFGDPDLGAGTFNVGKISGGTKVNIVPDYCEVEIDRRLVPKENPKLALDQFKKILKLSGVNGEIEFLSESRPAMKIPKNSELVKLVQKFSGAKAEVSTGYMEAELFKTERGIDCVAYGPGLSECAHIVDEYVPVKNLEKATIVYGKLISAWCH
ncbi:MAG TPA: M20 family metallopeptidase [archaeon]|nr:M20 family metallopeptidase [archaeon]